jgi:hypothetical protein
MCFQGGADFNVRVMLSQKRGRGKGQQETQARSETSLAYSCVAQDETAPKSPSAQHCV